LVAPFLTVDSDIYPAIVDGEILWIVDCYTTSSYYPNSQRISYSEATSSTFASSTGFPATDTINYIRNSVKATVNAYTGEVILYAWDETDPILQTWMNVYPGIVTAKSEISDDLMAHLRYPTDLFEIQREIVDRYHVTDPQTWFTQYDRWEVPADPVKESTTTKEPSYYLSIRWPEVTTEAGTSDADAQPLFSLTTVYTPYNRDNLSAYMSVVAEATSPDYGRIRILRMSDEQQIEGPGQAFNSMTRDDDVASALLPYRTAGSLMYGNLLTIPLGGGLLYVEPVYTQAQGTSGTFPILTYVVVRFGDHTGIAKSLQEALDIIFAGDSGAETGESGDPTAPTEPAEPTDPSEPTEPTTPTTPGTADAEVQAALQEAEAAFQEAAEALEAGDLGAYQAANQRAQEAIERALEAMGD
jgi:uncharacterized membrane protein (UPF0182 family)